MKENQFKTRSHPARPREKGEEDAKESTLGINPSGLHNSFILGQKEEDSVVLASTKHSLLSYGSSPARQSTLKTGFPLRHLSPPRSNKREGTELSPECSRGPVESTQIVGKRVMERYRHQSRGGETRLSLATFQ